MQKRRIKNFHQQKITGWTWVGLLTGDVRAGSARSFVLLLSRVAITLLFITVGISQVQPTGQRCYLSIWLPDDAFYWLCAADVAFHIGIIVNSKIKKASDLLFQAKRIIARDWAWLTSDTYLRRDGHDNNWVLLEAVLAAPLGIGWRTSTIAPLLALTCLLEAFICWPPWESWPSV